ncbi:MULTISPECIES: hypothetical protein [Pseudomonas]|uniref:hypothetical protein n=1 Tax=Pseudomonas TaxID=286 RepID=UPI0006D4578D|nr:MULTISPECIES: hypothetical protein [Pseudomonas]MBF8765331.1 hypothetical protein [Pseudomonas putida]
MQIAILAVLILILIVLAPWLLAVVAAAAVAYGLWVVVTGVAFFLLLIGVTWYHGVKSRRPLISSKTEMAIQRVNEEFRRKQAEHAAEDVPNESAQEKPRRLIACRSCSAKIEKFSMFCPACGKKPI